MHLYVLLFQQKPSSIAEAMILDTEAAVIANFEFLGHTDMDMEEEEGDGEDEIYDANTDTKPNKVMFIIILCFNMILLSLFINIISIYFSGIYPPSSGRC